MSEPEPMTLQQHAARVVQMAAAYQQHPDEFDPSRYVRDHLRALPREQRYAFLLITTVLGIRGFANALSLLDERGRVELDDLVRWQAELGDIDPDTKEGHDDVEH